MAGVVGPADLAAFLGEWMYRRTRSADIAPWPEGDGVVDLKDIALLARNWGLHIEN